MTRSTQKQSDESDNTRDGTSVDAAVRALYESVSFLPGSQPNYSRLRSLFLPDGRIVPPKSGTGKEVIMFDLEAYIRNSREYIIIAGLEAKGFFEQEVQREVQTFGAIAHVFSRYESRYTEKDSEPFQRGINSIQVVNDGGNWKLVSVLWDVERDREPG